MKNVIKIEHLHKSFGKVKAVQDLNLNVKEGELFAFLGVNGAGKSTTISIICSQLAKDSGKVFVNGKDLDTDANKIKKDLGVVFQNSVLDKSLTVKENLESRAALYSITGREFNKRLGELSSLLEFADLLKRPVGKLSGGQRRRIDIARALFHKPKILILDEPTTGLDPQTRKAVWNVVDKLRKSEKITVFLTTHYMEEAAESDYVVILDSGRIVAQGTPPELKNKYTGDYITFYGMSEKQIQIFGREYEELPNAYRIAVSDASQATELITAHPELFTDYEVIKGKMDDVFLASTGKKLSGEEQK